MSRPKKKVNNQGWEEISRKFYGIKFVGGVMSGGICVYILETVELRKKIDGVWNVRSEIQHADTIYPRDLVVSKPDLYRLIDSAAHAASWAQTGILEDKDVRSRAAARGTKP